MNLVLSGTIDDNLRNTVAELVKPRNVVRLHARAQRYESADHSIQIRNQVASLCDASQIDYAYVDEGKKLSDFKLLAMDMDSTLITIECIDEIADFAGKKEEVAAITEATMRGEIVSFSESLRKRVALLSGLSVDTLSAVYNERLQITEGAGLLVEQARKVGIKTILISGGFDFFSKKLQDVFNLDFAFANELEVCGTFLTGRVIEPIIDAAQKARHLQDISKRYSISREEIVTIGDGMNDRQMMHLSAFSIAFHASKGLQDIAAHKINYGPISIILDWLAPL